MTQVASEFDARIEMKAFIDRCRAPYSQWYVGVAADLEERLFNEHGVKQDDWWVHRRLASAESARRVEKSLLDLGCDGGGGGGSEASTVVYAYWKRGHTNP